MVVEATFVALFLADMSVKVTLALEDVASFALGPEEGLLHLPADVVPARVAEKTEGESRKHGVGYLVGDHHLVSEGDLLPVRTSRALTTTVFDRDTGERVAVVVASSKVNHSLGDDVVREGLALVYSVNIIEALEVVSPSVHVVTVQLFAEAHNVVDLVESGGKLVKELFATVGEVVGIEVNLSNDRSPSSSVELARASPCDEPITFGGLCGDDEDEVDCPVLLEGSSGGDVSALGDGKSGVLVLRDLEGVRHVVVDGRHQLLGDEGVDLRVAGLERGKPAHVHEDLEVMEVRGKGMSGLRLWKELVNLVERGECLSIEVHRLWVS